MNEIPNSNVNLERARQIVSLTSQHVERLEDTPTNAVVKHVWELAKDRLDLPIYTYTQTLLENGVDDSVLGNLGKLLVALKVDVSDPHASSSELSVMVGFMSEYLLGKDLRSFRRQVDEVKLNQLTVRELAQVAPDRKVTYSSNNLQVYKELFSLREWEKDLVLSTGNYVDISRRLLGINDETFEVLLRGHFARIWHDFNVDP